MLLSGTSRLLVAATALLYISGIFVKVNQAKRRPISSFHRGILESLSRAEGLNGDCGRTPARIWSIGGAFDCTTSKDSPRASRMTNGYAVPMGEFPSFVRVLAVDNWMKNERNCGGTLIGRDLVLTSANCFNLTLHVRGRVSAGLGAPAGKLKNSSPKTSFVSGVCVLPDYNQLKPKHQNIALLKLLTPFNYTDYIQPACIPTKSSHTSEAQCFAVGFGRGKLDERKLLSLPVKRTCQSAKYENPEHESCYVASDPRRLGGTCLEDEGGPVYCFDSCSGSTRQTAIGALSYTRGNTADCIPGFLSQGFYSDYFKMRDNVTLLLEGCNKFKS